MAEEISLLEKKTEKEISELADDEILKLGYCPSCKILLVVCDCDHREEE